MAEGTLMHLMDEKLAQHDELLVELRVGQKTLTATKTGIQEVWVQKYKRYFYLYQIIDAQKVESAALYLNGNAKIWYNSLVLSRGIIYWVELKEEICERFGDVLMKDIVEEFNKLVQMGSVKDYLHKFENLKAQMVMRNLTLNESHFLSRFIGALKEKIKFAVEIEVDDGNHVDIPEAVFSALSGSCSGVNMILVAGWFNVPSIHLEDREEKFCRRPQNSQTRIFTKGQNLMAHLFLIQAIKAIDIDRVGSPTQESMRDWPTPTTLRELRRFLGLAGYYRKYVYNYGVIYRPLIELLKKDSFKWSKEADHAFLALKKAMSSTPILDLPNYTKEFIVETDASLTGIGVVLMQWTRPLAYFSKVLALKHRGKSIYEKEYMTLLNVVDKYRHCLQYKHFVVRTDNHSLKYLLEQKITTAIQQKGLTKLLSLDYEVQYKRLVENKVADALSRPFKDKEEKMLTTTTCVSAISVVVPAWVQEIHKSYDGDTAAIEFINKFLVDHLGTHLFYYSSRILRKRARFILANLGH
ncbi:hypothetical protein FXO38_24561 [Capsicum annuum]|nr:hypothetical protein FXO38_24561 [Capsicum annuum]